MSSLRTVSQVFRPGARFSSSGWMKVGFVIEYMCATEYLKLNSTVPRVVLERVEDVALRRPVEAMDHAELALGSSFNASRTPSP